MVWALNKAEKFLNTSFRKHNKKYNKKYKEIKKCVTTGFHYRRNNLSTFNCKWVRELILI